MRFQNSRALSRIPEALLAQVEEAADSDLLFQVKIENGQ
jgi:hypothetical protein